MGDLHQTSKKASSNLLTTSNYTNIILCHFDEIRCIHYGVLAGFKKLLFSPDIEHRLWSDQSSHRSTPHSSSFVSMGL